MWQFSPMEASRKHILLAACAGVGLTYAIHSLLRSRRRSAGKQLPMPEPCHPFLKVRPSTQARKHTCVAESAQPNAVDRKLSLNSPLTPTCNTIAHTYAPSLLQHIPLMAERVGKRKVRLLCFYVVLVLQRAHAVHSAYNNNIQYTIQTGFL